MRQKYSQNISIVFTFILVIFLTSSISAKQSPEKSEQELIDSVQSIVQQIAIPDAPAVVTSLEAIDKPNDKGGAVIVSWDLSSDDADFKKYVISRSESQNEQFETVGKVVRGKSSFVDNKTDDGTSYYYQVVGVKDFIDSNGSDAAISSAVASVGPVVSSAQWFDFGRIWALLLILIVSGAIIFYINKAKSGADIYVRKIAGIDAVEEAVGRATEMGRKIFFIPGIQDMNDVQTIAGIAILGRVGELAAQYETWLEVPVSKSLVMVTARETLKEAYNKVGRPDAFNPDQVHYLTDDQFGYAAAIDGMVVREKPATIFYMGAFFAESLILAETGNAAGAIQIAGTAMPSQLPFFVASCDYTLLGEELFAASAYLSKEPRQLGSLKGQDFGKMIFLLAIIIGVIIETFTDINVSQYFTVE